MKILFLGLLYDEKKELEYARNSKIGLQGAPNIFQWDLISGMEKSLMDNCVTIYNSLPVGTFPKYYRKPILYSKKWSHNNSRDYEIGSVNLPIIKQITRKIKYVKKIKEWIEETQSEKHIIAYSIYPIFLKALKHIKKLYPEINITFVVPDLPSIYGVLPKNPFKAFIYKKYGDKILKNLFFVDSFVLLTEAMKEPLKVGERSYIILEGLVQECFNNGIIRMPNQTEKIILYTGTLQHQFGIKSLLDAFIKIRDDHYRLWICGSGEAEKDINELSEQDDRIVYYGYTSRERTIELQQRATVLINPRQNNGEYTKYSFPSKTMEYMASGKPVIMYKLDGIPTEYDKYLYYVIDNSTESLKNRIIEVCEKSDEELLNFGQKAKDFVLKEKNNVVQANRVINMLKEVHTK
ncbi:MAG: glycosyltransferase [Clostridia bacterium]